ncbi:MAG: putative molybdenum carrier protein [Gemmatimonadales bacterium]
MPLPARIISGAQTGVDRAALDVALKLGIPCGGWCPAGRRAEDGVIPTRYPVEETPSPEYSERTEWNVRDSDGTLIVVRNPPTGGTAQTIEFARRHQRPVLILDPGDPDAARRLREWLQAHGIRILNVAGPREGTDPGIGEVVREAMTDWMKGEGIG